MEYDKKPFFKVYLSALKQFGIIGGFIACYEYAVYSCLNTPKTYKSPIYKVFKGISRSTYMRNKPIKYADFMQGDYIAVPYLALNSGLNTLELLVLVFLNYRNNNIVSPTIDCSKGLYTDFRQYTVITDYQYLSTLKSLENKGYISTYKLHQKQGIKLYILVEKKPEFL